MVEESSLDRKTTYTMKVEELDGLWLMSLLLNAYKVRWNDLGGQSTYDCDILLPGGGEIAVEITEHVDPEKRAQRADIRKLYEAGQCYKQAKSLRRDWLVELRPRPWISKERLRKQSEGKHRKRQKDRSHKQRDHIESGIPDCIAGRRAFEEGSPPYIPEDHASRVARLPKSVRPLEQILWELETRDITETDILSHWAIRDLDRDTEGYEWELFELGVLQCRSYDGTGRITFDGTNEGTQIDPNASQDEPKPEDARSLEDIVRRYAQEKEDQLADGNDKDERHLLIQLDTDTIAGQTMRSEVLQRTVPNAVPVLPDMIDVVWLAVKYTLATFPYVLRADRSGWMLINPFSSPFCGD